MTITIQGPARNLLRTRLQEAKLRRVEGVFAKEGPAQAVVVTLALEETGRRLAISFPYTTWEHLRERIDQAFVFE